MTPISRPAQHADAVVARFEGAVEPNADLLVANSDNCLMVANDQVIQVVPAGAYRVPAELAGPAVTAFFICVAPRSGVKFGTSLGNFHTTVGARRTAFGSCTLVVSQPAPFLTEFSGLSKSVLDLDALAAFVGKKLTIHLKDALAEGGVPFDSARLPEVSARVVGLLNQDFNSAGLTVASIDALSLS